MVCILTKISIIIPVFNTAKYLNECLDSVINQSLTDIEVICVNDGSTDSSMEVLQYYQSKDSRIKILSQENKGLSSSRNFALQHATGEYILFIDSDDYIERDCLYDVYNVAKTNSLDMLMFKLINFDDDTYEKSKSGYFDMKFLKNAVGESIFSWSDVKNRLFDICVTAPGKLFKRNLISDIKFPEGLIFEDNLFFIKSFLKAKRVIFIDEYYYFRRLRHDSIINSYYSKFSDCIIIYDLIGDYLRKNNVYDELSEQLFNRRCRDIYARYSDVDDEFKEDFFYKIKENFKKEKLKLENEGTLGVCSERSLAIFNSAIHSSNYKEFEYQVTIFDLKRENDKLRLNQNILKRENQNQIKQLNEINRQYRLEIKMMKNSPAYRITDLIKKILKRIFH